MSAAVLGLTALLAGCTGDETARDFPEAEFPEPETRLVYEPRLAGAPNDEIADTLRETLTLWRRQEEGAASLPILRRRAQQDVEMAKRVLGSYGFYGAEVRTEVEEIDPGDAPEPVEAADPFVREEEAEPRGAAVPGAEPEAPENRAVARVIVEPGRPFILRSHEVEIVGDPGGPPLRVAEPGRVGSPVGRRAQAEGILAAEDVIVARLRNSGRPWAELLGRRAVIDPETASMRVTTRLAPGPFAEFDGVEVAGREQVAEDHIRSYKPWKTGKPIDRRELRDYQSELMSTRLFRSVVVDLPEEPPAASGVVTPPVVVRVEEAPARTVAAGLRYNTDAGPEARVAFIHRNLFNNGERLEIDLEGGLDRQRLLIDGRKPQFLRPGQDLTTTLELLHEEDEAFDETSATYALGLERRLDDQWVVGASGTVEYAIIQDAGEESDVLLFGLPAFVRYDGTEDLLNPVEGVRAVATVAPYGGTVDGERSQFLHLDLDGSGYVPLNEEETLILAGRARLGSILSAEFEDVPPTHRLYAGGGGSVRGYRDRFVGPLDDSNDPIGGRSALVLGTELRAPIRGDIGGAVFVEGGSVTERMFPTFDEGFQVAAGAGLRYYSPVGPIRFDVGVPLNPRDADDPFQLYFSIGQAY